MINFMDTLYESQDDRGLSVLGEYLGPYKFEHSKEHRVMKIPSEPDGYDVEIYEIRMPARFYKIKALDTPNSIGEMKKGFVLTTGTGMEKAVIVIAKALSEGMLSLN